MPSQRPPARPRAAPRPACGGEQCVRWRRQAFLDPKPTSRRVGVYLPYKALTVILESGAQAPPPRCFANLPSTGANGRLFLAMNTIACGLIPTLGGDVPKLFRPRLAHAKY